MSKLGVFDSGLGGFSIAWAMRRTYPNQDIVFLADQQNLPYGNKTEEVLETIIYRNMQWFVQQGVTEVILACNTTSVLGLSAIIHDFPELKMIRIIDITVGQLKEPHPAELLVLATKVTIASHAYAQALKRIDPAVVVHEIPMPNLAKLIEDMADDQRLKLDFDQHLKPFEHSGLPVILGCTHYPLVEKQLTAYLGGIAYSSINPLLNNQKLYTRGSGCFICYTTGEPDAFRLKISRLFAADVEVLHAEI
ncbi:Glutamate racemase [bioreactor metagenome]|uniref:Glutamate racemase n=1 Tax=bioreactor metagenome TaxID=1076179 RepID=A0A645DSA3_9ZZZZ|nr:aspartate/glutamate racemase family protein [Erysipelotrichaceae bacterium]